MPQPRVPVDKLRAKGSALKNPALFRDRAEPETVPLGPPSPHLDANSRVAWFAYVSELPWLRESDRSILEIASNLRGMIMQGEDLQVSYLNLLVKCIGLLGATPADRSKVPAGDNANRVIDPVEKFFQ